MAASRTPLLAASIAAWLEVLAKREPNLTSPVLCVIRRLVALDSSAAVQGPLNRLTGGSGDSPPAARAKSPRRTSAETEVYARAINAARGGLIIVYGDLESNRGHVGRYLSNIAHAEAALGRPPLTAIVVSKSTGLPGDGFLEAMVEVGYAHRGEKLEPVWKRAVRDVHAYWLDRPDEGVPVPA